MKSINILGVPNGVGINRDMSVIKETLAKEGYDVEANHCFRFNPTRKYDLNICLERFNENLFGLAKYNVMIPNQEWFELTWIKFLPIFHTIFTKTQYADRVFKNLNCRTEFISFTSEDRYLPNIIKDDYSWMHLAGKSVQKQTEIVINTWKNNPSFPTIYVVQDLKFYKQRTTSKNIVYLYRLTEQLLGTLQNTCAVHICPSETEGFGHYIMEGLSCKSLVVTTNAPPMNELVTAERGKFIDYVHHEQMRLSVKHVISEETLTKSVIDILISDDITKRDMMENGRKFYLENDLFFKKRLVEAVNNILLN